MKLRVEPLTADAFRPFGEVIEQPQHAPDATGPGWQWWGETALVASDGRPYGIGYLDLQPAAFRFDWAERHMRSAELLIPVGGDCLVYVGPRDHPEQPDRLPSLERFRVFRVEQGQGVLLHPGVWHGAPLVIDRPLNVVVLLLQATGSTDTSLVRFTDTPVEIQLAGNDKR
jgi:ureidoglycolate lyase